MLDTNVVISALFSPNGTCAGVLELALRGNIMPCASQDMMDELDKAVRELFLEQTPMDTFRSRLLFVEPAILPAICRDPDDDKFLACAVEADADCIITGDDDLLALREHRGIRIVTPRAFLRSRR